MTLLLGMKKPKMELVETNVIRTDLDTQSRIKIDQETVELYAAAMRERAGLPRILLFKDKAVDGYILVDGMHRLEAHKLVFPNFPIQAEVVKGTLEEARWFSYGMNATHGLNRSNADKNRAVRLALQHKMGAEKSNCEIAKHVGVDEKLVRRVREELESTSALPKSSKRVGRDGRLIDTKKIGKSKKQASEKKPEVVASPKKTASSPQMISESNIPMSEKPAPTSLASQSAPANPPVVSPKEKTLQLTERQQILSDLYPGPWENEFVEDVATVFPDWLMQRVVPALFDEYLRKVKWKQDGENVLVNFIAKSFFRANDEVKERVLREILDRALPDEESIDVVMDVIAQEKEKYAMDDDENEGEEGEE